MSLYVIATPIGNPQDLSFRAHSILSQADLIIGEEPKVLRRRLKEWGLPLKPMECLNEHSRQGDLSELAELCLSHSTVALVSDCGTPGFCDPGAELVALCRKKGVRVRSLPGPSSLMAFLSLCGHRLDQFVFRGFLPAETQARKQALNELRNLNLPIVLMDTPYRLKKTLQEIHQVWPQRKLTMGLDLSREEELILEGRASQILDSLPRDKIEFVLLLHKIQQIK